MWILNFIPDALIHLLLLAGVLGTLASLALGMVPFIAVYRLPIQIISILLLSFGLFLEGGIASNNSWEQKMSALKVELAEAKAKAAEINTVVVTKILTKNKIIKEKGDTITEYIDREIVKYDKSCPIPNEVILAHNAAATNVPVDTTKHNAAAKPPLKLPAR